MPIARFEMPDGRIARFEVPEGTTPEQAQAMIQKSMPKEEKKTSNKFRDLARAGLQGVSLGWSDEIAAGVSAPLYKLGELAGVLPESGAPVFADESNVESLISGKKNKSLYHQMVEQTRKEQEQFSKDSPVASGAAEVAGAMIPAVLTAGASSPQTLAQIAKTGAKIGAVQGGLYGAGTAEGDTLKESAINTAEGAAKGAAIGGTLGAAVPVALVGGARVAKGTLKNLANSFGNGDQKKAVEIIRKVANDAGISAEDAAEQLNNLGPKATLADVDENFLIKAKNAVNQYGPQKQAFRELVTDRQLGEHADVLKVLSKQTGGFTGDDVYTALQQTGVERNKAASPLYDKAFSSEIPEKVLNNPKLKHNEIIQKALREGEKYAKSDPDRLVTIAGESGVENIQKPLTPMERWHYAKKALWAKEQKLRRLGDKELANNIAKNRMLVDDVLNSNDDYKTARGIWSSSEEAIEAAKVGQDIFKMSPEEFSQAVKGMNEHDLQMAKIGVMNAATDKAGATKDARSIAGMLTDTENQRKKIKVLFGGEKELNELVKNAKKWETFRKTKNVLTSGSITAESAATSAEDAAMEIIANPKSAITQKMVDAIKGGRMTPETAREVGKILMKQGMTQEEIMKLIGAPKKSLSGMAARSIPQASTVGAYNLNDMMRR